VHNISIQTVYEMLVGWWVGRQVLMGKSGCIAGLCEKIRFQMAFQSGSGLGMFYFVHSRLQESND